MYCHCINLPQNTTVPQNTMQQAFQSYSIGEKYVLRNNNSNQSVRMVASVELRNSRKFEFRGVQLYIKQGPRLEHE